MGKASSAASGIGEFLAARENRKAQEDAQRRQLAQINSAGDILQNAGQDALSRLASNPGGYAGLIPEVATFNPINTAASQATAINSNLQNLGGLGALATANDNALLNRDLARGRALVGNQFDEIRDNLAETALQRSRGELSSDDVSEIVRDNATRQAALGRAGASGTLNRRDLGVRSEALKNSGSSLFQQLLNQANQISDPNRRFDTRSFFVSPQAQTSLDFEQAGLDQNQRQQQLNNDASPDPALARQLNLLLANATNEAAIRGGGASLINPVSRGSEYQAIGNIFGGLFGNNGFFSNNGVRQATPVN